MASAVDLSDWDKDPRLFLFTSLTAGSSHIITATSRLETILKANRLPFQAVDLATDEKARKLWGRRAGKKKLPGLVKEGYVIGDLEEVEEWNEFGELKENIGPLPPATTTSVHPVQTSLGNLRLHDAASQAAVANKQPVPSVTSSASKVPTPLVNAPADGPSKVATPLVNVLAAKKSSSGETVTPAASGANAPAQASASCAAAAAAEAASTPSAPPKSTSVPVEVESAETKPSVPAVTIEATQPKIITSSAEDEKKTTEPAASTVPTVASAAPAVKDTELSPSQPQADGVTEKKHRGSSVSAASPDEIKEVEERIAIPEDEGEEAASPTAKAGAST